MIGSPPAFLGRLSAIIGDSELVISALWLIALFVGPIFSEPTGLWAVDRFGILPLSCLLIAARMLGRGRRYVLTVAGVTIATTCIATIIILAFDPMWPF